MAQKRKKRPIVRDIPSKIKIVETRTKTQSVDLESDVEQLESQQESSFISRASAPTLRQNLPRPSESEEVKPRVREIEQARTNAPSDAQLYTAISTQNNTPRYTMHSQSKADARVRMHSRTPLSSPSIEPRSFIPPQEHALGRPFPNEITPLRSPWQEDRRYDLYREDTLENANRVKSRRR